MAGSSPPPVPATMTPHYVASNGLHPFAQDYPGDLTVTVLEQVSPPPNGTIDPSLLYREQISQYNSPLIPQYTSGDSHHQHSSLTPSISTGVWMGYIGETASTSAPSPISPISPTMNMVSAFVCRGVIILC